MKKLSIFFFVAALLLAGVAIAAVVVRAGDLFGPQEIAGAAAPGSAALSAN